MIETELKPIQEKAASLLACGLSVTQVASECGCSRQSLYNWLNDDLNFVAHLNGLRNEGLDATRTAIQHASMAAFDVIVELMNGSSSDSTRLAAAVKVIEFSGVLSGVNARHNDDLDSLKALKKIDELKF